MKTIKEWYELYKLKDKNSFRVLNNIPNEHFENAIDEIRDILFYEPLLIEVTNYDKKDGFSFSIERKENPEKDSIVEIVYLRTRLFNLCDSTNFSNSERGKNAKELSNKLKLNFFKAMEKKIPNFEKYKRILLRQCTKEEQKYFKDNGYYFDDLELTEEEKKELNNRINEIIDDLVEDIIKKSSYGDALILFHRTLDFYGIEKDLEYMKPSLKNEELDKKILQSVRERVLKLKEDTPNINRAKKEIETNNLEITISSIQGL